MWLRRFGAALKRLPVTSGASNAGASRSRANNDGDTRNSDTADAKPSGANTDGDTRNSGMADSTHNSDAASKDGTYNRSASIPWRRLWIVY